MRRDGESTVVGRARPFRLIAILVLTALSIGLAVFILLGAMHDTRPRWLAMRSVETIEGFILDLGMWGIAGAVLLMVLHSFVPFPAELVAIANGMVFGPLLGIVVTWSGAMLGAVVAFALARLLGRPFVARLVDAKKWQHFDAWLARDGWRVLLLARLAPIVAFNLVNYAAGLTAINWWTFLWTTAIGILPATVTMVLVGDRLDQLQWWVWLLLLAAVAGTAYWLRHRWKQSGLS